ncbi:MAG: DMT family transporter [Treponema sp.]|jgi:drug/metabolite transporter (DMT)-like permease|nr:DMT family transporter [Treponema sp.]
MNKRALRADILLLLTAGIWGFGFVAQRAGMEYVGPFAFNGIRFLLGSLSLVPLIIIRRKKSVQDSRPVPFSRGLILPSLMAGSVLFIAVMFQQIGIIFTTAGNAGFITGLYVVFTPIFGIFFGRKTGLATWIGSVFTIIGLYFLSAVGRAGSINPGDIIIFISAVFWTAHVLLIDRLMQDKVSRDPIKLSSGQFAVCGVYALLGAFFIEPGISGFVEYIDPSLIGEGLFSWQPFPVLAASIGAGTTSFSVESLIPILYGGFASVGIAYTLQVVAQRDAPPAHATIILCFEGCFAALGGVVILAEKVGVWTMLGFVLMLAGMLVSQREVIVSGGKNIP